CSSERPQVWLVMQQLLSRPVHSFVTCWNWKAAALSCILRVPVYVITTFRHGWEAIGLAACVEGVFSAGASGVYAAFREDVRYAVPEFVVAMLLLVIFPAITVLLDALFHYVMRTPNLATGVSASLAVSVVSSAFNWYSMRHGTLLVGPGARPFLSDLASLPILIGHFLGEPFVALWRSLKMFCSPAAEE